MATKTILLIEDNVDDEQLVRRVLEKNNVMNEVVVACDGEEALGLLHPAGGSGTTPVRPDLILLDLHLPGISGVQVLEKIREDSRTKTIPVVIVTSDESGAHVDSLYEKGANSLVIKPTNASEFSETFLNVSMYWLLLNVGPVPSPTAVR
mgnify:CR=1 FL=1